MDESSGDIKIITEYGLVFKEGISREIYEKLKGDEKFNKMFKKVDYIYVNDEPLAIMIIDGEDLQLRICGSVISDIHRNREKISNEMLISKYNDISAIIRSYDQKYTEYKIKSSITCGIVEKFDLANELLQNNLFKKLSKIFSNAGDLSLISVKFMLTLKDETPSKKLLEIPIRIGYSNRNSVIEKQILITSDEERFKILSDFFSVKK